MKKLALALLVAAILVPMGATESEAKLDPLKYITDQLIRPDVMIMLDTSGSMHWQTNGVTSGTDCSGHDAAFDICGDFMCSGHETVASCANDCQLHQDSTTTDTAAGNTEKCRANTTVSRMFMAKRALRNVLPDLRTVANFGLTTFETSNYHRYYTTTGVAVGSKAIYLHEWELRPTGSWTKGNGWASGPAASFVVNNITYTLNGGTAGDSLYRRSDSTGFVYARFNWATAGRNYNSGGFDWEYLGSYFTTPTFARTDTNHISTTGYMGPFYNDGSTTYVHNRFGPEYTAYGLSWSSAGALWVPFNTVTTQADADNQVGLLLNWLSEEDNGGIRGYNNTPTGEAIQVADTHFQTRDGLDPHSACRPRFNLVLTDGQSNGSTDPWDAAKALYNRYPLNPIKTFAVALPGTPSADMIEMDRIADAGDDGDDTNNSASALYANNEKELVDNIRKVLYGALAGEYTTASSAVTTSAGATITGDTAIVPSTSFPSWDGHLRCFDLTVASTDPNYEKWDAGALLNGLATWYERRVFTAPASGSDVVPMWDHTNGDVNTAAIKAVWPGTPPLDAQVEAMVRWLGGFGRTWRLGSVINTTPAIIGAPPSLPSVKNHDILEAAHMERQRLVYLPSNEGLIHAFCAETGKEMFAFVPPSLFPKIYSLYSQGGQNADPTKFEHIMTNSPRVEDMADKGGDDWTTTLVQTFGGGGENFVVLDVSDPTSCSDPKTVSTCSTNTVPVKVIFRSVGTTVADYYGDTWSVPALFWNKSAKGQAAGGSGYAATASEGEYYGFWDKAEPAAGWDTSSFEYANHPSTGAQVDFAVVAHGVAVRLPTGNMEALATYQGSLNGTIMRYDEGKAGSANTVLDAGTNNPFFFSPAAYYRNSGDRVTLAAASGAYQANDNFIVNGTFKTTLYMRTEDGTGPALTGPANDEFTCSVDQICSASCYLSAPVCADGQPSDKARVVASPLLLDNKSSGMLEAFYLLYDPPASVCNGNTIAIGDSWLIRVGTGPTGQELKEAKKYPDTQVSGLTLVAGGKDIGLSVTGRGTGSTSKVETKSGTVVGSSTGGKGRYIESWREVR